MPRIWLMTDPRLGDGLLAAVRRLPAGSGVIFRHNELEPKERRALFRQVARICRQRGHLLFLAGDEGLARRWGADGFHAQSGRQQQSGLLHSAGVHNTRELAEAKRGGADILLTSPVYETRSHPGARALGVAAFRRLALLRGDAAIIALGGMSAARARMQDRRLVHGWAAIDAFGDARVGARHSAMCSPAKAGVAAIWRTTATAPAFAGEHGPEEAELLLRMTEFEVGP